MAGEDEALTPGEIRRWLTRVERKLDNLSFVHPDTYAADQRTAAAERAAIEEKMKTLQSAVSAKADDTDLSTVRALALWAVGLMVTAVLGGLFAGVFLVVRA